MGGYFFLLNKGPTCQDIGLVLSLWTGVYNWKMIAFAYLEKADFWYGLERKYDYRNYKEMVGKVISTPAFILELLVARKNPSLLLPLLGQDSQMWLWHYSCSPESCSYCGCLPHWVLASWTRSRKSPQINRATNSTCQVPGRYCWLIAAV